MQTCVPSSLCLFSLLSTLFSLFNLTSLSQFNLLTLLILPWPCSAWCEFVSFPFPPPCLCFPFPFIPQLLLARVPALWANNLIISHFTTQTHKHITDCHEQDVFVAPVPDPVRWVTDWAVPLSHCDWMQEKVKLVFSLYWQQNTNILMILVIPKKRFLYPRVTSAAARLLWLLNLTFL